MASQTLVAFFVATSLIYCAFSVSITFQPFLDVITYSTVRVLWRTDVASSTFIKYSTTSGNLDLTQTHRYSSTDIVHQFFLSGLNPSTTYYLQACSTDSSNTACSNEVSFTTLSAPATIDPIPPQEFDSSMPVQDGEDLYVGEDCNDPETGLQALINKANWGDTIYISPDIICSGSFNYPYKDADTASPHRWIVIRSSADDDKLPPAGVRYNPDLWPDSLATIQLSASNMVPSQGIKVPGTPCTEAIGYYWMSTADTQEVFTEFPMRRCGFSNERKYTVTAADATGSSVTLTLAEAHTIEAGQRAYVDGLGDLNFFGLFNVQSVTTNTVTFSSDKSGTYSGTGGFIQMVDWIDLPYTNGNTRPTGDCTEGSWYFNAESGHVYLCSKRVKGEGYGWSFMSLSNAVYSAGISGAFVMKPNAHHLHVMGLKLTVLVPEPLKEYAIGTPDFLRHPLGATYTNILYSATSNHHIVFDRCEIDGQIGRARVTYGAILDGSNIALTNSHVHGIGYWQNVSYWGGPASNGIIFFSGRGPGKIVNNFIEIYGLSVFFSDDAGSCVKLAEDYVIDRNHFIRDDKYRFGSDTFLGLGYSQRQLGEHKVGKRARWSGNRFENNWVEDVLNGASIALTPRPGSGMWYKKIEAGKLFPLSPPTEWAVEVGDILQINSNSDRLLVTVTGVDSEYLYMDSSINFTPESIDRFQCMSSESNHLQDILVEGNYFHNSPSGLFTTGHHEGVPGTPPFSRLRVSNNVFHNMNTQRGGVYLKSGGDYLYYTTLGPEDHAFEHNTVIQLNEETRMKVLTFDSDGYIGPTMPGNRFGFKNNICWWPKDELMIRGTSGIDGKYWGTISLDVMWTDWDVSKTLVIGQEANSDYPADLLWELDYQNVFTDAENGDYSVKEGPYKNAATDGTDIGYNKDRFEQLQGVVGPISVSVSGSTVTFSFKAPDSQPCHVDIHQNSALVTRVKNESNQRDQTVSTTLPNGDYTYNVLCAVYQPGGSFNVNNPNSPNAPMNTISSAMGLTACLTITASLFVLAY